MAGANQPGDVLVIFGATLIVWVVAEEWRDVPGLTTLPNIMAGQVMIGGPSNAGALFVDWAGAMTGGPARRKAAPHRPDAPESPRSGDPAQVPVWLPYLRGERTPFHDPMLRSSLHGLDIAQGPDSVLRAAHEASGFVVRRIIDRSGFGATLIVWVVAEEWRDVPGLTTLPNIMAGQVTVSYTHLDVYKRQRRR